MTHTALLLIVLIVVIMFVVKCARVVPEKSAYVVERLGRFNRVMYTGFNMVTPFIEQVRYRRSLEPETMPLKPAEPTTADGQKVTITCTITLMVTDVKASCYNVANYKLSAAKEAQQLLTEAIMITPAASLAAEQSQIEVNLQNLLNKTTLLWGVETTGFDITDTKLAE